ncbi:MAG: hypothetical protein OSA99_14685 [Acidimicrobiales bacterium]|nr:hypothetical protein [Acidimicrobiales bacterium]
MSESDDTPDGPAEESIGSSAPRTVPAGAFIAAVLVAGALGILAVVALAGGSSDGDRADDARFAAGRFAERFLTFEHDALDDWKADVLSLSTGGFAGEVEDVEEGLRRLIGESELDAQTQVTEIFVGDVDSGTASVVVIYDRDVSGEAGVRSEADRYMQLELNLVDGEWLVDNVLDIATAGGLDDPSRTSAPDSTAPDSTTADPEAGEPATSDPEG